jgi:hypothetical protein
MSHVAQLNVARFRFPLDSPEMADFMNGLEPVNALAERSPGFVWRLVGAEGLGATDIRGPLGDDVIMNMSVWESLESLRDFTYHSGHLDYLRRRREWLHHEGLGAHLVLWWIEQGHIPTVDEAAQRLAHLVANGPSGYAFTLRDAMSSAGGPVSIDPWPTPTATPAGA